MSNWRKLENGDWQLRVFRRETSSPVPYVAVITVSQKYGIEPQGVLDAIEGALASQHQRADALTALR